MPRSISYKVTWPKGVRYFTTLGEAQSAARHWSDPDDETNDKIGALTIHKVLLTRDAFERAVNGGGGYEEQQWERDIYEATTNSKRNS